VASILSGFQQTFDAPRRRHRHFVMAPRHCLAQCYMPLMLRAGRFAPAGVNVSTAVATADQ